MNEPTPKDIHSFDQIMACWRDTVPKMLKSLYDGFVEAGFQDHQALQLVQMMWLEFNRTWQNRPNKKE